MLYHCKQVNEHGRVVAQHIVGIAAQIHEFLEIRRVFPTHHVCEVMREHERRAFALNSELLLVVPQEMPEIDVLVLSRISYWVFFFP